MLPTSVPTNLPTYNLTYRHADTDRDVHYEQLGFQIRVGLLGKCFGLFINS